MPTVLAQEHPREPVVGLCAVVVALQALRSGRDPEPIVFHTDTKKLLDPRDLASVRASSRWMRDASGASTLHLRMFALGDAPTR